jgi:cobaltochelatase CobT
MTSERRRQQQVQELAAASVRALSGEADVQFRGQRLHRGGRPLPALAPHLQPSLEDDDFGSFRGAADGVALRLSHSDLALHASQRPADGVERVVFDLLEQFRVESLAPHAMPGVAHNLRHRHEQWSESVRRSGLTDSASGLLLYTVAQVARARVTAQPVVETTEGLIEGTRMALAPLIGTDLAALRRTREDQRAYAVHALAIARAVGDGVREALEKDGGAEDDATAAAQALGRLLAFDARDSGGEVPVAGPGAARTFDGTDDGYRVFTTAYDTEHRAASLVRAELLREYREQLDRRIAQHGVNVPRLARELKAMLAAPHRDGWDGARDEGRIDGRRLAQLVASPGERRLFRVERERPVVEAVVTFLVDCSGSMKQHAQAVALLVDVLGRALEQAGASTEVLGFTTNAWNGGRARRDWLRAGRPAQPGRLNEVCHLVFKDAGTPWRPARRDVAALLKADLFREGIDGEAVEWACRRLASREEARRILVVISDGCPMDGATALANGDRYLDEHLKDVVSRREREGIVRVCGLGVGLDLSPYYRRSLALDAAAPPSHASLREIAQLIGRA